jgi:hypothetical protein
VFKFLCKARKIDAGSCVSVRVFMSGEMLAISRLNIKLSTVVRTIFHVILRYVIKSPIYNAFRFLIIAMSSQNFVKGLNVESFSRGRQTKTLAAARKPMKTHGWA